MFVILRARADASRVRSSATVPDWEAEGLLEGLDQDERRERVELLDYLHDDVGIPVDRLRGQDPALLVAMPAERHVGAEPRYTPREVAEAAGIDLEVMTQLRRAMGLPAIAPDDRILGEADLESTKLAAAFLHEGMPEDDMLAVTRVLGRGLGQAAVVMRQTAMRMALEPGLSERELAERFSAVAGMLTPQVVPLLEQTLKLHLRQMLAGEVAGAAERRDGSLPGARDIGVGFADLVGFTRLGEKVPPEELGAVAARLEDLATVVDPPVRLVKTIGDAAMFVATSRARCSARRSSSRTRPTARARTSRSCASALPRVRRSRAAATGSGAR